MSTKEHATTPHIVYLSNAYGEATGDETPEGLLVSAADWKKVPFENGPGNVFPYLAAVDGRLAMVAHLPCVHADPWHLEHANVHPLREAVSSYLAAAMVDLQRRAGETLPPQLLPIDDTMPGRLVLRVAVDLAAIRDRDHAIESLRSIFGAIADLEGYPSFADDAEALADACGGFWSEHPDHPIEGWQLEVAEGDTRLGYWDWVASQVRRAIEDAKTAAMEYQRPVAGPSL